MSGGREPESGPSEARGQSQGPEARAGDINTGWSFYHSLTENSWHSFFSFD